MRSLLGLVFLVACTPCLELEELCNCIESETEIAFASAELGEQYGRSCTNPMGGVGQPGAEAACSVRLGRLRRAARDANVDCD